MRALRRGAPLRVLIVEDDDCRMLTFDAVFGGDQMTRATTAADAIDLLWRRPFDLVMLDRDLGPSGIGEDVARTIAEMSNPPPVFVHSWNPDGARAIHRILHHGGVFCIRQQFCAEIAVHIDGFLLAMEHRRRKMVIA